MLAINPLPAIIICQYFLPFSRLFFCFVYFFFFFFFCYAMCVCQVISVVSDSLQPYGLYIAHRLLCPLDSPGKNTEVDGDTLLQGIFLTQGSNPSLLSPALSGGFITTNTTWEDCSFAMQKLLSLIRSHLLIFAFIFFALGDGSKRYCCDLC